MAAPVTTSLTEMCQIPVAQISEEPSFRRAGE